MDSITTMTMGAPGCSPTIAKLAEALAKAQGSMRPAAKDRTNTFFSAAYATLASVWDACRGPLAENGLSVVQLPSGGPAEITVQTLLLHTSGEWIASSITMRPKDATPQGVGSAITYARRYALSAMVGIAPDDDDDDGNAASAAPKAAAKKTEPAPKAAAKPVSRQHPEEAIDPSSPRMKKLHALMREVKLTDREVALAYFGEIIGRAVASSKEMSVGEVDQCINALQKSQEVITE